MFCGEQTLHGTSTSDVKITPLRCRSWTCDECHPQRLRELRELGASGVPTALITLTVNPAQFPSPDAAAQALVRAWRNIRQRAARENLAERIPFLAVFESTRAGWPHLHILARTPYLDQRWLSRRAAEYLRSPVVDIRRVYNRRHASRYIAKYVSKDPHRFSGVKRYWRSQDYSDLQRKSRPVTEDPRSWDRREGDLQHYRHIAHYLGWRILEDDGNSLVVTFEEPAAMPHRYRRARDALTEKARGAVAPLAPLPRGPT